MSEEEEFRLACGHLDTLEPGSGDWFLTKAYVRLSTGRNKLERWRTRAEQLPTNHEMDLRMIQSLAAVGMLRLDVQPFTLDLYPTPITERVMAEMDRRDDPNKPAWGYQSNPAYGMI